jgi:hypothetical protein
LRRAAGPACCDARLVPPRWQDGHIGEVDASTSAPLATGSSTDYYWDMDVFEPKLGQDILARASSSASHRRGDKTIRR